MANRVGDAVVGSALTVGDCRIAHAGAIPPERFVRFLYNATDAEVTVCVPDEYVDLAGEIVRGMAAIPAWGSRVLFFRAAGAGCP